jgi:tRNA A-37 threonylcarbamoyl transferase component Bud32
MASPADIKEIFLAASDRPASERAAFLDNACGGNLDLRQRVEALLKAHDATGGWLGDAGVPTSDYRGFTPPSVAELAPRFPQLEILELLGQGGMGAVYKARQKNLDRLVALKILPHDAADKGFAERFTREARTLAKLNHPGIVAVHDFGTAGDLYWFVMEFVDGVNLRQAKKAGTLTPATALAIVPQICEALQFAHDAGVVHRDIKPENVLLDAKGRVKIADFGLAKLLDRAGQSHLTGTHQAMGTPHYMAPEQWEKPLEVDHRADIYSLGVVFYELLTGELPLGRFPLPSQKVQVDVRLDEVVLKTLEKEPQRRYQQVSEVKTEVERIGAARYSPPPSQPPATLIAAKREPSFFWRVAVPTVFLSIPLIFVLLVWRNLPPGMQLAFLAPAVAVALLVLGFLSLWLRWRAVLGRPSVNRLLAQLAENCHLHSPMTWAVVVCVLGIANSFSPWLSVTHVQVVNAGTRQTYGGMSGWQWVPNDFFGYSGPLANSVFPALVLVLFVLSAIESWRPWRALATLVAGIAALLFSIAYMRSVVIFNSANYWYGGGASWGPHVAATLAGLLLVIGALDLRGWLTSGASNRVPSRPVGSAKPLMTKKSVLIFSIILLLAACAISSYLFWADQVAPSAFQK